MSGTIRKSNPSPFLRGQFPNPLTGVHLSWFTELSGAMSGSTGSGSIFDSNGKAVGGYKSFGGLVHAWFSVPAGESSISFPSMSNRGPCHLSDGTTQWPDANGNLTVNPSIDVDGWITYRG